MWPDTINAPPDILLSIGTGCNAADKQSADKASKNQDDYQSQGMQFKLVEQKRGLGKFAQLSRLKQVFDIMKNRVDNITDTEVAWNNFYLEVYDRDREIQQRYQRFNPDLKHVPVPKMDDVARMEGLRQAASDIIQSSPNKVKLRGIAHRLVAACFYFEKRPAPRVDDDIKCHGEKPNYMLLRAIVSKLHRAHSLPLHLG